MNKFFHTAAPNEIQVDLDSRKALTHYYYALKRLKTANHVTVIGSKVTRSKSRGHYHATVTLAKKLPIMERIAIAAGLGDDPIRVLLNWGRARNRDPHPILFIEDFPPVKLSPRLKKFFGCECEQDRCQHLKALQSSRAEFEGI